METGQADTYLVLLLVRALDPGYRDEVAAETISTQNAKNDNNQRRKTNRKPGAVC